MAIQTINLTVPGGDTPRSANTKINANFTDASHASSRLVGTGVGQVPLSENVGNVALSNSFMINSKTADLNAVSIGKHVIHSKTAQNTPLYKNATSQGVLWHMATNDVVSPSSKLADIQLVAYLENTASNQFFVRTNTRYPYTGWTSWALVYTSANTTVDGNGVIKVSSPVLRVFSDHIEGNDDANSMQAVFTKNDVGDYTISGTSGLSTDGWYITLPNDMNGNPKVAVTLTEKDGVVSLKSYKRIFDMNSFTFKPDLDQPLDIPDGRWIDLRFEELPSEVNP